jgi:thiamine biosynthesis lipoprotein
MAKVATAYSLAMLLAVAPVRAEDTADSLKRFEFEQIEMGVDFRISLYACDSEVANNAAKAAFERIQELNHVYSDYTADSELRQLCENSEPGRPVQISDDLLPVIDESLRLSRESNGAFDITVGPLTKLWRRARRRKLLPEKEALASAMSLVGYKMIRLNRECQTVELLRPGMRLDLGGIAKGRAADEALEVMRSYGIRRALVDASGDLVAGDPPPGGNGWVVDIANLDPERSVPAARIELSNCAVATSGDAFQSVEIAGRRYSHIVNPRTGFGLSRRSSVTVIAPTGMGADSLASALSVLEPETGLALLRKRGESQFAALLVLGDTAPAAPRVIRSRCFSRFEVSPKVE